MLFTKFKMIRLLKKKITKYKQKCDFGKMYLNLWAGSQRVWEVYIGIGLIIIIILLF